MIYININHIIKMFITMMILRKIQIILNINIKNLPIIAIVITDA